MRPSGVATITPLACANCFVLRVVGVAEAERIGERLDGGLVAGQEVEAVLASRRGRSARRSFAFFCRASSGVSEGSKLTAITSNCLPALKTSGFEPADQAVENLACRASGSRSRPASG